MMEKEGSCIETCSSTTACQCDDSKVKAALWEVCTESHPFAGASRHSVGKEHNEHTAGLDVFSLEITPAEEALINKLKANANLINALLGIQSTSQHLIRKRITVSKIVHQGCCCVVWTNRWGTRENTASRSKSRKGQIWERRYVRQSVRSSAPTPNCGNTYQHSSVSR